MCPVSRQATLGSCVSLDVFVFPTYTKCESLGLVGLEAMSCEVLVTASNCYGPTSYLVDKKNDVFVFPEFEMIIYPKTSVIWWNK